MAVQRKVKLKKIANIINGMPNARLQGKEKNAGAITYSLIQPNHLGIFNDIHSTSEIKRRTAVDNSYFVRKNDILFKRLNPDMATLIVEDISNTVFSSNLFVIRVFGDYHPAYIACLLENQGMVWLNSNIVGSVAAVKSVSAKLLAELEIPVINYDRQTAIGELWLLYKKRKRLLRDMMEQDQRLMAALTRSITAGAKGDH